MERSWTRSEVEAQGGAEHGPEGWVFPARVYLFKYGRHVAQEVGTRLWVRSPAPPSVDFCPWAGQLTLTAPDELAVALRGRLRRLHFNARGNVRQYCTLHFGGPLVIKKLYIIAVHLTLSVNFFCLCQPSSLFLLFGWSFQTAKMSPAGIRIEPRAKHNCEVNPFPVCKHFLSARTYNDSFLHLVSFCMRLKYF